MTRTLGAWACLTACVLFSAGCRSEDPPPESDTPWPILEEAGDALDTGALAPCSHPTQVSSECGEPSRFNLSRCDRATLASAPTEGVFILKNRAVSSSSSTGGFLFPGAMKLGKEGSPSVLSGGNVTVDTRSGDTFYLSRESRLSNGDSSLTAYAGCQLSGTQQLTGCYVTCRNGQVRSTGTFEAFRATRREGEQEAEGIQLVSESFVSLGLPVDIYVARQHAYVVSMNSHGRTGGLSVFDVADPAQPVFRRTVTMPGDSYWNGVWAQGDALYVASSARGVLVFDLGDPANPVFVKSVPEDPINVHTVFVEGDRLYAMSPSPHSETLVFDISQPQAPVMLTRFSVPGGQTMGYPHDAFAYEGRLYINHWSLGYVVMDVSNPLSVKQLGKYQYPNQTSHANAVGTIAGRTIAFEGGENHGAHLRVLDVTDPAAVVKIGEWRLREQASIHNMVLVGTRLYIAWYHEGVRVLDVADPSRPRQLAYFNTFRETDFERGYSFYEGAIGMRVPGDGYVYTVDSSRGLLIFREP
jgi:hypothetical protein